MPPPRRHQWTVQEIITGRDGGIRYVVLCHWCGCLSTNTAPRWFHCPGEAQPAPEPRWLRAYRAKLVIPPARRQEAILPPDPPPLVLTGTLDGGSAPTAPGWTHDLGSLSGSRWRAS
jgi:hypothetical protein